MASARRSGRDAELKELPQVTIVMPVRDEERYIERSLGSVLAQDYPADRLQILVADGGSTDGTRKLVQRLAEAHPDVDLRVIDNPRGFVAPGLNLAIAEARGEVIVRVDGHCEITPGHVRKAVEYLSQGNLGGVGGPIETVGETPLARDIAAAMSSHFGVGGSAFRTGGDRPVFADTIPFPAYPRHILNEAGPFDEELVRNQDDEYNYRLRHAGHRLLLAPDLESRYYSRSNLRSLFRQYFQYGFYKARVLGKHPRQMSPRQFVPPLFVALLILAALLAPWSRPAQGLLLLLIPVYMIANLSASFLLAAKDLQRGNVRYFTPMPAIFAALHFGYGSGFLAGFLAGMIWPRRGR